MSCWKIWGYLIMVVNFISQDYLGEDFKSQGSHVAYAAQDFATQVEF